MIFDSVSDLFLMDGHGSYVWFSYGVTLLVLLMVALEPGRRRRAVQRRVCAELRRAGAQNTSES